MTATQNPDPLQSASYRHMAEHLGGPLAAGAKDSDVPVDIQGRVTVERESREPVVLVAPRETLDQRRLRVVAVLDPDGSATGLPPLEFAPFTEAGSFLPLHVPPVSVDTGMATSFTLDQTLTEIGPDGQVVPIASAEIADKVEVRLLEGNMGRMIYIMGAEKQRIRREVIKLTRMRELHLVGGDALDRIGAGAGVSRFVDGIKFDAVSEEIVTGVFRDAFGNAIGEPDSAYARRLAAFRPWYIPNRRNLLELLNGPGDPADSNTGLISGLGFIHRFRVIEEDNEFAVAMHLVASGDESFRTNFLEFIHRSNLVAANSAVPDHRFLESSRRQQENELRNRLRTSFRFEGEDAVAPMLAVILDRVGRCRGALGVTRQIRLLRAQDSDRGSRYELGLGADIQPQTASELDRMAEALGDPQRVPTDDAEIEGLLQSMVPAAADVDPDGRWLLEVCGLRTVHRLSGSRIYVSHVPASGMLISGPSTTEAGTPVQLEALFHASGDPGGNVVLLDGLERVATDWIAANREIWAELSSANIEDALGQTVLLGDADPAAGVFRAAGLVIAEPDPSIQSLKKLPPELIAILRLADTQAQEIVAGQPSAVEGLGQLVGLLEEHGLVSVSPFVTQTGEVILVTGVIGLPGIGSNLAERRASGFRWYVVPIQGRGGKIKVIGSRTEYVADGPGLSAIVAIGYARRGNTDPYEFRVELPTEARLNLEQYEFLMNLLNHAHPVGVAVNTFSIRQRHVDLDGDGNAERLPPTISRTFRPFHRRRARGEIGVPIVN